MSNLKNINLEVAQFALKSVKEVLEYDNKSKISQQENKDLISKKYKTISKKMTVLIQKNGLIGSLVFIISKKEKSHEFILKNAREWCSKNSKLEFLENKLIYENDETFIESITNTSNQEYRLLTKEIMTLFAWIKRFADGMIEGEDDNGDD